MVDGNDAEWWSSLGLYSDSWLGEERVDRVDWDRVVWVGSVAGNVADDAEFAVLRIKTVWADEWWDRVGEIDAVDKDLRSLKSGYGRAWTVSTYI